MKQLLPFIFILLSTTRIFSQEIVEVIKSDTNATVYSDELLEKLANESCVCLKKADLASFNQSQIEMQLGVCLLQSASINKAEIEKTTGSKSLNPNDLESFGELVGMKMAFSCPEVFMFYVNEEEYATEEGVWNVEVELGKIKSIEKKQFNTVNLEMADDSILKFIWLWDFEGSEILIKNQYKNKWINIFYSTLELYDPEKKKYIAYRVIEGIEFGE